MNSDYILRMIEQFVQALVAIVTARRAGKYEEAFHQIQSTSQRYLQTDITLLLNQTPDQLLEYFKRDKKHLEAEKCVVCADLLYETALICQAKQCEDLSTHAKLLCLNLYLNAIPKEKQFQTEFYEERVRELMREFESREIPEHVKKSLLSYQAAFQQDIF